MGGRSRFCYHGIAQIIRNTLPSYLKSDSSPKEFKPFSEYMENVRLNINARQVFKVIN